METHVSASQPQPPAFAEKPKARTTSKVATAKVTKPLTAAKVNAKVSKPKPVPARLNAKGSMLRCMVVNGTDQCHNPQRHPHGKAWTCSTHDRAIRAGRKVRLTGKATLPYVAPHATVTAG